MLEKILRRGKRREGARPIAKEKSVDPLKLWRGERRIQHRVATSSSRERGQGIRPERKEIIFFDGPSIKETKPVPPTHRCHTPKGSAGAYLKERKRSSCTIEAP